MFAYYSSTTFLIWMALGVLCLLVHENARIHARDKGLLYLTYVLIAVSALAEYVGIWINGREQISRAALLTVKALDYILTPLSGVAIVLQLKPTKKWKWFLGGVVAVNTVLQLLNPLTGWMVVVGEGTVYHHGPLYPLYFGICILTVGMVILHFILYGRSFHQKNRKSLYAIMLLILCGIVLQEVSGGSVRTSYLALTFGAALIFIHYVEFGARAMDDDLKRQQIQLDTDALTGVYSRLAYSYALKEYDGAGALPEDLVAITIDINGLKRVNDSLGHEAGDELIRGAADCITSVMGQFGRCYRTGGDEFVILAQMDRERAAAAIEQLNREAAAWHGKSVQTLAMSAGFALAEDHRDISAEKLVSEADKAMYEAKAAFYRQSGMDRRSRR